MVLRTSPREGASIPRAGHALFHRVRLHRAPPIFGVSVSRISAGFSRITLKSQATSERCGRCDFDGRHPSRWKSDPGGQLLDRSSGYVLRSSRSQVRALEAIFVNLVQLSPDVRLRGTPVGRLGKILTSRRCGSHSNTSSSPSLHTLYGAHYHPQVKRKGPETKCLQLTHIPVRTGSPRSRR